MYVWLIGMCTGVIGAVLLDSFAWVSPNLWWFSGLSFFSPTRIVGGMVVGCLLFALQVQLLIDNQFDACVTNNPYELSLIVATVPTRKANMVRFEGNIIASAPSDCSISLPARVRVAWMASQPPVAGAILKGRFKLRPVHGFSNPGGFDFERWMFARRLVGSAFVISAVIDSRRSPSKLLVYREKLHKLLDNVQLEHPGVQWALASGDTGMLEERDWKLFRNTGTVHLMIVSGFHVSLVAAIGVAVFRCFSLLLPGLYLRIDRQRLALIGGGFAALSYVVFVGLSNSSLRALVQVMAVLIFLYIGRRIDPLRAFILALSIVLLVDPLATLKAGFWFSFLAVWALIIRLGSSSFTGKKLRLFITAQFVVLFSLAPIMMALNGGITLVAPVANFVLIPVVSLVVVPLSLLGIALLPSMSVVAETLLNLNDLVVSFCYWYMQWLQNFPIVYWPAPEPLGLLVISSVAGLAILLPIGWRPRLGMLCLFVLCLWPMYPLVPEGEFRIQVLDVGQGEAVLVDTRSHRLLFDTAPKYASGFDVGEAVVVPSVRATGPPKLDMLIVSHGDIDHAGGMPFVKQELKPLQTLVGSDLAVSSADEPCRRGHHWQWDGVDFQLLHPGRLWTNPNNGSCVLLVASNQARVLLTGDIDKVAEFSLEFRGLPQVDMLVVPHHGSRSSTSSRFLNATQPYWAVVSVGRDNQFGHPHREVVARLKARGSRILLTHECGAVLWKSWQKRHIRCHRKVQQRFWQR